MKLIFTTFIIFASTFLFGQARTNNDGVMINKLDSLYKILEDTNNEILLAFDEFEEPTIYSKKLVKEYFSLQNNMLNHQMKSILINDNIYYYIFEYTMNDDYTASQDPFITNEYIRKAYATYIIENNVFSKCDFFDKIFYTSDSSEEIELRNKIRRESLIKGTKNIFTSSELLQLKEIRENTYDECYKKNLDLILSNI